MIFFVSCHSLTYKKHTFAIMRFVIVLMLLCASFGFSCHQEAKEISLELAMIDSIMWDHPDSALTLLEKMPKPSRSDKLNDATWCLLYTQAWDKNYKKHTSDSLINVALHYFDMRKDGRRKAQAWFYKGAVCRDLSKLEDATACYVRARDLIGSFDDPLFASLISQTLGRVYREQYIYDKALELFREAVYYVTQVPRRDDWSHAYSELGRTFAECKQLDSAHYYFERSLENGVLIDDLRTQAMAIGELGVVYYNEGDYKRALEYQKKELALKLQLGDSINFSSATFGIAVILYRMGELDSAEVYFKESLNTSNLGRIQTTNLALYFISRRKHNHEEAFKYIDQYRLFTDSINNVDRTGAIAEAQEKYDNEKLENEKKTLLLEKERLQKSILWGGLIVILVISLTAFTYQRKLWLKEKKLRKSQEDIQEYLSNLHTNEEKILEKQASIQSLSKDLEEAKELERTQKEQIDKLNGDAKLLKSEKQDFQQRVEEYTQSINENREIIKGQIDHISRLQKDTVCLMTQNQEFKRMIDEYSRAEKQNEDKVTKLEKLSNQILSIKKREFFLIDYINNHVDFFKMLRENPCKFSNWTLLYENLDILYNSFYTRLKKECPSLSEVDLQVCCLIKIGLTTSQIANIICITGPSVSKRKFRIRERMNQDKEGLLASDITLDVFLMDY